MPSLSPNVMRGTPRFYLLDLLRLGAAVAVMLYHYTSRTLDEWGKPTTEVFQFLSHITAYGFLGVQLFFIISGFVIFMSAENRTVGQFVSARFSRLYPAYWTAVILASLLIFVTQGFAKAKISVTDVLTNLTMTQAAFNVDPIDGVYWTLWIELLFYIMITILIARKWTESTVYWFTFLWPLLGGIAQVSHSELLYRLISPQYAPFFAGGMLLYMIYSRGHNLLRWMLLVFNVCVALEQAVRHGAVAITAEITQLYISPNITAVLILGLFILVATITVTPLRSRGKRWMITAGALTYPLYLTHQIWGLWVIGNLSPYLNKWVTLAAAFAFSFALAFAIERWVERPLRPRLRRGLERSFQQLQQRRESQGETPTHLPS